MNRKKKLTVKEKKKKSDGVNDPLTELESNKWKLDYQLNWITENTIKFLSSQWFKKITREILDGVSDYPTELESNK